jgi:hypothetical protein
MFTICDYIPAFFPIHIEFMVDKIAVERNLLSMLNFASLKISNIK